jgi:hypothetical protein
VNISYLAAISLGMALLASLVNIKIAVPVPLVEIVIGALGQHPGHRRAHRLSDFVRPPGALPAVRLPPGPGNGQVPGGWLVTGQHIRAGGEREPLSPLPGDSRTAWTWPRRPARAC